MGTILSILSIFMTLFTANYQPASVTDSISNEVYSAIESPEVTSLVFDMVTAVNPLEITIDTVGDCTIGYDLDFGYNGSYNSYIDKYGFDYPFKNVLELFKNDDITVANLETTLTDGVERAIKEFKFKGEPEYVNIIKNASIEAVNISNNHIHDYLTRGYNDTLEYLKKAGIGFFGEGNKYIKEVKGIKVGFLGYTGWDDSKAAKDNIYNNIQDLKKQCRIVIVSFHWGIERENYPDSTQTDLGRFCIDSGADLVFGHHPHVIQGIETYKGKNIVYSQGNFSYGGHKNPADKDTFIFRQIFRLSGSDTYPYESQVIPCLISSTKTLNNYQPTPLTGDDAQRVIGRLKQYSAPLQYGYDFNDYMVQ